ncbi:hypothetical protein HMPREF9080_00892, partial [Cardiobacterium valvarum F0432]
MLSRVPEIRAAPGFSMLNHWIFQETGQLLRVGFALDDAKGNAHTAGWCAGADVVFYV